MKNIEIFIKEALSVDGSKIIQKYLPTKNADEFTNKLENDGWELDLDYNEWTAGDCVVLLYRRDNEKLWVEWSDRKGNYDGDNLKDSLSKLKIINGSEYRNKK